MINEINCNCPKKDELPIHNELPIRFGSALYSKLNKKYWELDSCKDIPIAFAIEAFFDEEALSFSSSGLTEYLYGIRDDFNYELDGKLQILNAQIDVHKIEEKTIPSVCF